MSLAESTTGLTATKAVLEHRLEAAQDELTSIRYKLAPLLKAQAYLEEEIKALEYSIATFNDAIERSRSL